MGYQIMIKAAAVVWTAVVIRLLGPPIVGFLTAELPVLYGSILAWLTPPYLYFVINGIILSIAASSRFHNPSDPAGYEPPQAISIVSHPPEFMAPELEVDAGVELPKVEEPEPEPEPEPELEVETEKEAEAEAEEFVISRSSWSPKRREMVTEDSNLTEKPLVSVRFSHRKSVKPSPEGKPLRVARPRRNETLESTWKAITEGRAVPLARHLKKSDTWEARGRGAAAEDATSPAMRKSETFHERGAIRGSPASQSPASSSAGRVRREASLGQDDLNRRVEAFIKKFNEEMRLQRQESFKHYMEMVR